VTPRAAAARLVGDIAENLRFFTRLPLGGHASAAPGETATLLSLLIGGRDA